VGAQNRVWLRTTERICLPDKHAKL
jgi:hypothetical protein